MEDSVALANIINKLAKRDGDDKPSKKEVTTALQQYEDERKPRLKAIHKDSAFVTRLQSYDTWYLYILMRWILPWVGLMPIVSSVSKMGSQGPRLEYVDVDEKSGTLPWLNPQPTSRAKAGAAA